MTLPISLQPNIKAGMCPHGLPQSSCPICSKQAGGGMGMSRNSVAKHKHAGEWSYQKCYVAGLQIKAAMQHRADAQNFLEKQLLFAQQVNKNLQSITDKLNQFIQNIKSPNIQTSMQFLMNNVVNPLFNTLTQISKFIDKLANFQQKAINMLLQAGEKLANILGEIKNFVEAFSHVKSDTALYRFNTSCN